MGSAHFVTALPKGSVRDAAVMTLRMHGVDISSICKAGSRVGIYYLEAVPDMRAFQAIYDRVLSAASETKPGDFECGSIFSDATWFQVTSITPAILKSAADTTIEAVNAARAAGALISFELSQKLLNYGIAAHEIMRPLVEKANYLIANEEDIQLSLGIISDKKFKNGNINLDAYKVLTVKVRDEFPGLSGVAVTLRESYSADKRMVSNYKR